jgi:hypothetical protein
MDSTPRPRATLSRCSKLRAVEFTVQDSHDRHRDHQRPQPELQSRQAHGCDLETVRRGFRSPILSRGTKRGRVQCRLCPPRPITFLGGKRAASQFHSPLGRTVYLGNRGTHFSRPHLQGAVGMCTNCQVRGRLAPCRNCFGVVGRMAHGFLERTILQHVMGNPSVCIYRFTHMFDHKRSRSTRENGFGRYLIVHACNEPERGPDIASH